MALVHAQRARRIVLVVGIAAALSACGNARSKRPKSNDNPDNVVANNTTSGVVCGDGLVGSGETCDSAIADGVGSCPTECRAPACHTATVRGTPAACDAECLVEPVGCADGDGCCSIGCDATTDSDCTNICGDGVIAPNELCDSNCPTTCGSPTACSSVELVGDPTRCSAQCVERAIEICQGGDGCCPPSCDANHDADCGASCGNGTLEPGESCDADCPTSCDDGVACTRDLRAGAPETCNVVCLHEEVRVCVGGDGCCPAGCTSASDSDCSATCGDGSLDPGELCDGNCPASCNDGNACTRDMLRGAASTCNAQCTYENINVCQGGDGCCPAGCSNANDSDCSCTPATCQQLGIQCGPASNGCGGTLQCGTCSSGTCDQGICDGGTATSTVGAPCTRDADCTGGVLAEAFCITAAEGYPGGYCSAPCQLVCADFSSICAGELAPLVGNCYAGCVTAGDCRTGYDCVEVTTGLGAFNACLP